MDTYFSREIFLAARAEEAGGTVAAVKAVTRYHEKNEAESRVKLEAERSRALMEKQDGDTAAFRARLAELMEIPEADKARLRELALAAGDATLAVAERRKAEEEYDALVAELSGAAAEEAVRAELAALAETALGDASWFMREHDRKLLALAEDIRDDGRTDYTRVAEDYTLVELARVKELVLAAVSNAAAGQWELKQTEWALAERAFYTQYADWTAQINIVLSKSAAEWQKAEETLNAGYNEWRRNFERTYAERTGEWLESYEGFLEDKDAWMREQYLYAANYANYGIMEQSGMDAGAAVADALKNMENAAKPLEEQGFDTEKYIEQLVGDTGIAALMAFTGDLNGKAAGAAGTVRRGTALAAGSASDYAKAEAVVAEIGAERRVAAARLAAEEARKQLAAARKSYAERLAAENKGMKDWEISMVRQNGYTAGSNISRTVVTDSLLFENKHETQTVHIYEDFVTADAVIATSLDDENLEGLDDYGVMMMLAKAQKELADWGEGIFGRVDDRGGQVQIRIARNSAEAARDATEAELKSSDKTLAFQRDGKLGEHIGYAPVFKDGGDLDLAESRSRNVRYTGAGEMGKIMLDFQWNDMMRGKGYGEMAAAVWDKRMWDDDGSWLKAPTLRTVTDIAVSVAFGPAGGLLDDAVFALLDGAGGYKGWDEIGVGFGKKVLTTAVTAGVGSAFDGMNAAIGSMTAGIDKTIAEVAGGFMQGTVTNLAASAIGSISYSGGSFGFDTKGFGQSVQAGLVGSLVQGVQTAASGLINIGIEGLIGNALGDTSKMSNFFGGLAGQGVNAALGGDFTLNVLNLGFLAGDGNTALDRILSTGLLEMHLGGESGFGMNIGTGGVDASIGNLMAVGRGTGTYIDVNSRLAGSQQAATAEFASAMRTWYSGTEEQRQSFDDALTNRLLLVKGTEKNFVDENDPSKTTYAQTKDNEDGTRTMTIGTAALGLDSRFGLNVVFAHEAYRDGIDNGEEGQRLETNRAVEGHVDTALALMAGYGNASVGFEFMAEAKIFDMARTTNNTEIISKIQDRYDSSADFWKVMKDGSIFDDGNDGVISFEDGRETIYTQNKGKQSSLEEYLELEKGTGYSLLQMGSAGFAYDEETKTWTGGGTISADVIKNLMDKGIITADVIATPETQTVGIVPEAAPEVKTGISAIWDGVKNSTVGQFIGDAVDLGKSAWDEAKNSRVGQFIGGVIDKLTPNTNAKKEAAAKAEAEAKAQAEAEAIKAQMEAKDTAQVFPRKPVDSGPITSPYGKRDDVKVDIVGTFHSGIDYGVVKGTGVFATGSGEVVEALENQYYGKFVAIKHDNGFTSYSMHLDTITVKLGDVIKSGTLIGTSGNTGKFADGAYHLHYSIYPSNIAPILGTNKTWDVKQSVDPKEYLPKQGV